MRDYEGGVVGIGEVFGVGCYTLVGGVRSFEGGGEGVCCLPSRVFRGM